MYPLPLPIVLLFPTSWFRIMLFETVHIQYTRILDAVFVNTEAIMETAPCETDPFKPHLYSKKGFWGVKVKIINNVSNCGFQE